MNKLMFSKNVMLSHESIDIHEDINKVPAWDADDLYPYLSDSLKEQTPMCIDWNILTKTIPGVIIHDKLMTDAVLGTTAPIKTEHSYSLNADGDSASNSTMNDDDEDYFANISLNSSNENLLVNGAGMIKSEPLSTSNSAHSSRSSSPQSSIMNTSDLHFSAEESESISKSNDEPVFIKIEPGSTVFHLPPTPPSCSSDDSEDNIVTELTTANSNVKNSIQITSNYTIRVPTVRQPIQTSLISTQPKGSNGSLFLTDEEKRTLISEGYTVPTKLPLTKVEEKSLKKIRRKIKNKISAQESRRKKKEYMDQLERKVDFLISENNTYRSKIDTLENCNQNLLSQLQKLQAIVARAQLNIV